MDDKSKEQPSTGPVTNAGKRFLAAQTDWYQDTRLLAEAVFRLRQDDATSRRTSFSEDSWRKRSIQERDADETAASFNMARAEVRAHLSQLDHKLLESRFVFLETLWEAYLHDLVVELPAVSSGFFEDVLKDGSVAPDLIRRTLQGKYASIEMLRDDCGVIFADRTTRSSFTEQWKKLAMLLPSVGAKPPATKWFHDLEVYFCMRNCVIHRGNRVSHELAERSEHYREKLGQQFRVHPGHLDYYRKAFLSCVIHIEGGIRSFTEAQAKKNESINGTK